MVTYETLVRVLYADGREPHDAKATMKVTLCKLRKKLSRHGIKIICVYGMGLKMLHETRSKAPS